ncbi:MAG: DUF4097 domain-containing protein [Clostridia bacterium]|nr:DUF4097 domain-containing protein [Clostridia bacterium]
MKKVGIIILILILISMVIGLCKLLVFSIHHNSWNWFMGFGNSGGVRKEENIRKEQKIDIADVTKINLEFKSSDLNVFFTEDNQIRVVQYAFQELSEEDLFRVNKTSSSINISEYNKPRFHFFYFGFIDGMAYDVYIPKNYEGSLEMKAISGDIEVNENLKFEDLVISSTSGDIKMGNVEAKSIQVETTSGDIKLQKLTEDTLKLKSVSGDITVEEAHGTIEAKTTSGSIEVQKIEGKVEFSSISGDIKSDDFKITGNSKIKTTSGNVRTYLNQESNCEIQTKSVSGNITLPNRRNVMGHEPYVELAIETISRQYSIRKIVTICGSLYPNRE